MKANELMIGDWVYNPFTRKTLRLTFGRDIDLVEGLCLEPIPLTKEVLEKNGFEKQDDGWYKITLEEENLIGVQPFENVNWIFGANVFPNIIEHLNILYVHELQHALRLCGIEIEIKL